MGDFRSKIDQKPPFNEETERENPKRKKKLRPPYWRGIFSVRFKVLQT